MTDEFFSQTFLPLQEPLYRVAYHLLKSEQAAEDAVQELYLKLWRGREGLGNLNNPKAYCITVLRNLCLDSIRRNARCDGQSIDDEGGPPGQFSQEDSLDAKQRLQQVQLALSKLSGREALVLRLRTQEELSYEEISARTGINQLMLRVLLSNARKKIKNSLQL